MKKDTIISVIMSVFVIATLMVAPKPVTQIGVITQLGEPDCGPVSEAELRGDALRSDEMTDEGYYQAIEELKELNTKAEKAEAKYFAENEIPFYSPQSTDEFSIRRNRPDKARTLVPGGSAAGQRNSGIIEEPQ